MSQQTLSIITGCSYLVIFFAAIFANFFVLDSLIASPVETVSNQSSIIRLGIIAFLVAAVFDVFVAWGLYHLYKTHILSSVSTYFRLIHAGIMGLATFALVNTLYLSTSDAILEQVDLFNTMWLIGLFFFGVHLILLGCIVRGIAYIPYLLMLAGVMYILDTTLHFLLPTYSLYADLFLIMVAVPAILGEMWFTLWLLIRGGKTDTLQQ